MATFESPEKLFSCLRGLGATRVAVKFLAENDNSKQQIYLGGSFEVVKLLPAGTVRSEAGGKRPNFKASLDLHWIADNGRHAPAPGAQLILYPDYPEVRLSGFLRGCDLAPSQQLQPVPPGQRKFNNGPDGRVLCFGIVPDGRIFAHLAPAGSPLARALIGLQSKGLLHEEGKLWTMLLNGVHDSRSALLQRLREIQRDNPHESMRLNAKGEQISYRARNGGGYTLEALFGIIPNGRSEPDFEGWELKAYGSDRITLMTPEPDTGFYGIEGTEAFVRKYGKPSQGNPDTLYFTGLHRVGQICASTGMTLGLRGFDPTATKITDVEGGIELIDRGGQLSAGWSFRRLIEHWSRKHSSAAYIPYLSHEADPPQYSYTSPVLLGEGTRFERYLGALQNGSVVYDPGSKVEGWKEPKPKTKPRSQFRIGVKKLGLLYEKLEAVTS